MLRTGEILSVMRFRKAMGVNPVPGYRDDEYFDVVHSELNRASLTEEKIIFTESENPNQTGALDENQEQQP